MRSSSGESKQFLRVSLPPVLHFESTKCFSDVPPLMALSIWCAFSIRYFSAMRSRCGLVEDLDSVKARTLSRICRRIASITCVAAASSDRYLSFSFRYTRLFSMCTVRSVSPSFVPLSMLPK